MSIHPGHYWHFYDLNDFASAALIIRRGGENIARMLPLPVYRKGVTASDFFDVKAPKNGKSFLSLLK